MTMSNKNSKYQELFEQALRHQNEHNCGARPFEEYQELIKILKNNNPKVVLEIGSGVGFSTSLISEILPKTTIQTIEMETTHIQICSEKFKLFPNIELLKGEAKVILPKLITNNYDLIFFDGYAPQYNFLIEFERILKKGGILISANCHLKGPSLSTTPQYLKSIQNKSTWDKLDEFGDSVVLKLV